MPCSRWQRSGTDGRVCVRTLGNARCLRTAAVLGRHPAQMGLDIQASHDGEGDYGPQCKSISSPNSNSKQYLARVGSTRWNCSPKGRTSVHTYNVCGRALAGCPRHKRHTATCPANEIRTRSSSPRSWDSESCSEFVTTWKIRPDSSKMSSLHRHWTHHIILDIDALEPRLSI